MNTSVINIFIDNNAWDVFYDYGVDLVEELPESEFKLKITPEVELEIQLMPEDKLEFVNKTLRSNIVAVDRFFGFAGNPRAGGFASETNPSTGGRFISSPEQEFINSEKPKEAIRPTGLRKDEADIYLAARSLHSAVLTCNVKTSLKRAKINHDGRIVDLKKYRRGDSLAEFIKKELKVLQG